MAPIISAWKSLRYRLSITFVSRFPKFKDRYPDTMRIFAEHLRPGFHLYSNIDKAHRFPSSFS